MANGLEALEMKLHLKSQEEHHTSKVMRTPKIALLLFRKCLWFAVLTIAYSLSFISHPKGLYLIRHWLGISFLVCKLVSQGIFAMASVAVSLRIKEDMNVKEVTFPRTRDLYEAISTCFPT